MTPVYTRPITPPKTRRDGLENFVQMIINCLEAGEHREALLKAVDLRDCVDSGIYDSALGPRSRRNKPFKLWFTDAGQKFCLDVEAISPLRALKTGIEDLTRSGDWSDTHHQVWIEDVEYQTVLVASEFVTQTPGVRS